MGFKENLKSELTYSGMLVKELAEKSGVAKYSIDNYLNKRGQVPSVEVGVKIAQALGVTVEYLVTGAESQVQQSGGIGKLYDRLDDKDRQLVLDLIQRLSKHG
jgi:transcriptional regulator with XRE-family HTH domain